MLEDKGKIRNYIMNFLDELLLQSSGTKDVKVDEGRREETSVLLIEIIPL